MHIQSNKCFFISCKKHIGIHSDQSITFSKYCHNHSNSKRIFLACYSPILDIRFGTGLIKGEYINNTITIANISISTQTFGLVYQEEGNSFLNVPFERILNLSPSSSFSSSNRIIYGFYLENIKQKYILHHNIFSIFLSNTHNQLNIIFGSINPASMLISFNFIDCIIVSVKIIGKLL